MIREYKLFLQDILDAINDIDSFVKGMNFMDFCRDEKTKSAVVWKIEVVGEATKNIPQHVRSKYKEVPWKDMAKIRDKIATSISALTMKSSGRLLKTGFLG